jgi:hypothetical protein
MTAGVIPFRSRRRPADLGLCQTKGLADAAENLWRQLAQQALGAAIERG